MTLWLVVPLALLLVVMVLILSSSIHFHFRLCRLGKDDRVEFDIKALYGLVKFHFELPKVVFENFEKGIRVKLEESGIAPVKKDADIDADVDKKLVSDWFKNIKEALKATLDFNQWLKMLLSHFRISKLDWSTDFSLGDAAYTATAVGALWGLKWTIVGWASRFVRLKQPPRIFVAPVFQDEMSFSTEAVCVGKLSLGYTCYACILLLRRIFKIKGGWARWKALLSRKESHS